MLFRSYLYTRHGIDIRSIGGVLLTVRYADKYYLYYIRVAEITLTQGSCLIW